MKTLRTILNSTLFQVILVLFVLLSVGHSVYRNLGSRKEFDSAIKETLIAINNSFDEAVARKLEPLDVLREKAREALARSGELLEQSEMFFSKTEIANKMTEQVLESTKEVQSSIRILEENVSRLSTIEVMSRLDEVERRAADLSGDLEELKILLSSESATQLLKAVKLAQEVDARQRLEDLVRNAINQNETRVNDLYGKVNANLIDATNRFNIADTRIGEMDSDVRDLLKWIIGAMASTMFTVICAAAYLGKLIATSYIPLRAHDISTIRPPFTAPVFQNNSRVVNAENAVDA